MPTLPFVLTYRHAHQRPVRTGARGPSTEPQAVRTARAATREALEHIALCVFLAAAFAVAFVLFPDPGLRVLFVVMALLCVVSAVAGWVLRGEPMPAPAKPT